MIVGPAPFPAPLRRRTPVRRWPTPAAAALLAELHVVDPPPAEWAWVTGLTVLAAKTREESTS